MSYERTEIVQPSGIVSDLSPFELPPNIWSEGDNINFRRGRTNGEVGFSNPYPELVLGLTPTFLLPFTDGTTEKWLYCGYTATDSVVATTDGATIDEIGDSFTDSRKVSWTGCNFNNLIVLNNRSDAPQMVKDPYTATATLANWASTAPWGAASRCEVIRPYKNYLIAIDCYDEDENRYSNMVRWSSPAQLGEAPPSWDASVVGEQAGLYPLADSPGRAVDGLTLGDYFVIYKTDAVWLMQFIGGEFTMKFRKLFGSDAGILSKDCVTEFQGKHFVLSPSGCYIHNGSTKEDVMDGWVEDEFFYNTHPDYIDETKVVADHNNNEIYIYYISKDNTEVVPYADRALVWNWVEKSWSRQSLNQVSYIAQGYVIPELPEADTWDTTTGTWDEDVARWDGELNFTPSLEALLMASYPSEAFYAKEYTAGSDFQAPSCWVKRIGIDFNDDRRFKMLERIVPHITGTGDITITVYASDVQTPSPIPSAVVAFNPETDVDVDIHVVGRYLGIKFEASQPFVINGYSLEWKPVGNF